jgi:hypothetical protein
MANIINHKKKKKKILKWQTQSALHALGNIAGESRPENKIILSGDAEESFRRLIYETASKSSKLTLSVSSCLLICFSFFNYSSAHVISIIGKFTFFR